MMRTLTASQMTNLRGSGLKMETLYLIFLAFFPHLCQKCCCWFKPEFGVPHFAQAGSEERLSNPVWFYLSGYLLCYLQLLHCIPVFLTGFGCSNLTLTVSLRFQNKKYIYV